MLKKLEKLIEPLSKVLELDIEVVDKKNMRLVSTGIYKEKNNKESTEIIYKSVVQDKTMKIIENPRNNNECKKCLYTRECSKTILVAFPILVKEEIVGVISFYSFNREKREQILSKIEEYVELFKELAERIGENIFQNEHFEIYNEVFQNALKGIFITDEKGIILEYNKEAHRIFFEIKELLRKKIIMKPIGGDRFKLQIGSISLEVNGKLRHLDNGKNYILFKPTVEKDGGLLPDGLLLGKSKVIMELQKRFQKIIKNDNPILIKGEVGTDKQMFARWIHNYSNRAKGVYLSINCREENEDTLDEKIFGIDVDENLQIGLLEGADNGTLFIEKVEWLPLNLQRKLLHYLKTSRILPLNSKKEIKSNVRIIFSSNEDLLEKVKKGEFLENLYYKINAVDIEIPSLKNRKDDLEEIIDYLLEVKGKVRNRMNLQMEDKAKKVLIDYEWKGNWKELEGVVELLIESLEKENIIKYDDIPEKIKYSTFTYQEKNRKIRKISEVERDEIALALLQYGDDTEAKKIIAKKLGIGIATLYRKIDNYQIDKKNRN